MLSFYPGLGLAMCSKVNIRTIIFWVCTYYMFVKLNSCHSSFSPVCTILSNEWDVPLLEIVRAFCVLCVCI